MQEIRLVAATSVEGGKKLFVEATQIGPIVTNSRTDVEVSFESLPGMEAVWETISEMAVAMREKIEQVKPKKATVEFGIEVATEGGSLTALLVKGTGKANLKITLEWS
jgi:Trypsin-co-occurring domain 1